MSRRHGRSTGTKLGSRCTRIGVNAYTRGAIPAAVGSLRATPSSSWRREGASVWPGLRGFPRAVKLVHFYRRWEVVDIHCLEHQQQK